MSERDRIKAAWDAAPKTLHAMKKNGGPIVEGLAQQLLDKNKLTEVAELSFGVPPTRRWILANVDGLLALNGEALPQVTREAMSTMSREKLLSKLKTLYEG